MCGVRVWQGVESSRETVCVLVLEQHHVLRDTDLLHGVADMYSFINVDAIKQLRRPPRIQNMPVPGEEVMAEN